MFRRDEFIRRLNEVNSKNFINDQIEELENYVDTELNKNENLIKFVNSISAGISGTSGEEILNVSISTNSVHKDITVSDSDFGVEKITDNNGNAYTEYKSGEVGDSTINLEYPNGNDASLTPWYDVAILNPNLIDGYIEIELPENTNKMVAYLLAEKYMKVDDFDENDGEPKSGFWSKGLKPNDSNNTNISVDVNDAVSVKYFNDTNKIFMRFKLF